MAIFKTGNGESGNGERGTGNGEWGTGNGERGMGNGAISISGNLNLIKSTEADLIVAEIRKIILN